LITFEDWLLTPEIKQPYEIIDGEIVMTPAPVPDHQWVLLNLASPLRSFVRKRRLGVVLVSPVDVVISRRPLRTRQPDMLFLSAKRTGILGREQLRKLPFIEVSPDIVAEVLSKGNTRQEMNEKLEDYKKIGALECWLLSTEAETIEVVNLSGKGPSQFFRIGDKLRSRCLPDFSLAVKKIFE